MNIQLNTPVTVGSVITEVSQSADTKRYSFIAVGGTSSEKREAAEAFFGLLGEDVRNLDAYGVTRPWGTGLMFFIRRTR